MSDHGTVPLSKRVFGYALVIVFFAFFSSVITWIVYEHAFITPSQGTESEYAVQGTERTQGNNTVSAIVLKNGAVEYRFVSVRRGEMRNLTLTDGLLEDAQKDDAWMCRPTWKVSRTLRYIFERRLVCREKKRGPGQLPGSFFFIAPPTLLLLLPRICFPCVHSRLHRLASCRMIGTRAGSRTKPFPLSRIGRRARSAPKARLRAS